MKTLWMWLGILLLAGINGTSTGQERPPREIVSTSGTISLSAAMPFAQAIRALSEISSRTEQKVVVDQKVRPDPINVEIVDMPWREALDLILKVHKLELEETDNYIMITEPRQRIVSPVAYAATSGSGLSRGGYRTRRQESEEIEMEYDSKLREVNIEAIFFEGDKHELRERGINWTGTMVNINKYLESVEASQNMVGAASVDDQFHLAAKGTFGDVMLEGLLKTLETETNGEVLASPNIQVVEGEEGRVQVGQDISIKQFDFAGNVIDRFISSGIIMTVKAYVIEEDTLDFIFLDISAEKSKAFPGQLTTTINKTQANTSLYLLDGERAVMAGLYTNEESKNRSGVPLLKDLPPWFFGLRYIFGYDRDEKTEKELIIILKATLLPHLSQRYISGLHSMEYVKEKREELRKRLKEEYQY